MPIRTSTSLLLLSVSLGVISIGARSTPPTPPTSPATSRVEIPRGAAPDLDGTIAEDEWKDALAIDGEGATQVFLKCDGTNLYIGLIATPRGVANVYLADDAGVHVLHASAALGSVLYERGDDKQSWRRTNEFDWQVRTTDLTPEAHRERMQYLEQHGWVAPNGNVGTPHHWEFIIKLERLGLAKGADAPRGAEDRVAPVKLAICYLNAQEMATAFRFPSELADDCISHYVQSGNTAETQHFDPETWATLVLK